MTQTQPTPTAPTADLDGVVLDPERLDAYQVARSFYALALTLLPPRREGELPRPVEPRV